MRGERNARAARFADSRHGCEGDSKSIGESFQETEMMKGAKMPKGTEREKVPTRAMKRVVNRARVGTPQSTSSERHSATQKTRRCDN